MPVTFWDAIVTRNSGSPIPTSVDTSNTGDVQISTGARPTVDRPGPVTATTSATGTAQRRANRVSTAHTITTGAASSGTSATACTGERHSGSRTPASIAPARCGGIAATSRATGGISP